MASLELTFGDLYTEVEKYLGTYNSGSASAAAIVDAKFIVNRAYAKFISYYDWTFLYQLKLLKTNSSNYIYALPSDFSYLTHPRIYYDSDIGYPAISQRSPGQIIDMRSDNVYSNYPMFFALQAGNYHKETGQGWNIMFYPNPNTKYYLRYHCKINPEKLSGDTDIPIGGADTSDCLLELSLAYAEAYKDERKAVHAEEVDRIITPTKLMDNKRRTKELGSMLNNGLVNFDNGHGGDVIVST